MKIDIKNSNPINIEDIDIPYKKNLDTLRKIAQQKDGDLLSKSYLGSRIKLSFKCKQVHTFKLSPHQLKNGKWCKECT